MKILVASLLLLCFASAVTPAISRRSQFSKRDHTSGESSDDINNGINGVLNGNRKPIPTPTSVPTSQPTSKPTPTPTCQTCQICPVCPAPSPSPHPSPTNPPPIPSPSPQPSPTPSPFQANVPADILTKLSMPLDQAYITNQRYTNDDVIWGRSKGMLFGDFPGSHDEQKANLYPDGSATYFFALLSLQSGWKLTLTHEFPHCRYLSYTVANQVAGFPGQFGGGTSVNGKDIVPDVGSVNPFSPGVSRDSTNRNYTFNVIQANPPAVLPPNTLYVNNNNVNKTIKFVLRTYLVDRAPYPGYDGTGNVLLDDESGKLGLPVVSLTLPSGQVITGPSLLTYLQVQKVLQPAYSLTDWTNAVAASNDTVNAPILRNVTFERFWSLGYNVLGLFYASNPLQRVQLYPPSNAGGFSQNVETQYLSAGFSLSYGEVLVVRGKMPSYPRTQNGDEYFDNTTQLQYFSIGICGSAPSGGCWSSYHDEEIPVDEDGYYTAVVSWPWNRPVNAVLTNNVTWLNPGYGEGTYVSARNWIGALIIRFQNPNPNVIWPESPVNVPMPTLANPVPQESVVMGEYYPRSEYMSKAQFEAIY